jgi:hypothetical protein
MKKLKQQYRRAVSKRMTPRQTFEQGTIYPEVRSHTHKHFSTKQEQSFYVLHLVEYQDYPLKLRAARGRLLPNPWDDYPSYVDRVAKSWKHNSRRTKQYYR